MSLLLRSTIQYIRTSFCFAESIRVSELLSELVTKFVSKLVTKLVSELVSELVSKPGRLMEYVLP